MEKNAILAIVLSVIILIVWQQIFIAPRLEEERARQEELDRQEEQAGQDQLQPPVEQVQSVPAEGMLPPGDTFHRQLDENAQNITVKTPLIEVAITTQGARITEWKIQKHKDPNEEAVELVSDDARQRGQYPLEVYTGDASLDEELNTGHYQSSVQSIELRGNDSETLSLSYVTRSGLTFTKKFTFYPDSYKVDLAFKFSDPSQVGNALSVVWGPGLGDPESTMRFEPGVVSKSGDNKPIRDAAKKIDGLMTHRNVLWAAVNRKYFTAAFFTGTETNTLSLNKITIQPQEDEKKIEPMRQLLIGLSQPLSSGESQLSLYVGPKERTTLAQTYPGFEKLIDYGFFWFIAEPLHIFMIHLASYIDNGHKYGLIIICITILIKILFYPLTRKSFQSMKRMQELQPKMNAIKEKFKKDQQKQQQETMKLYKQEGVNPMGGCLPMVLQIPVFFALYKVLSQAIELLGADFLWISDLSAPETIFFRPLVLMMGASMFLQQSMTPTAADNKQAQMFKFMPILFTAMFWSFPSGLVLYWFMNNILTIGQQYLINKSGKKPSKKSENTDEETTSASISRKRRKKGK